MSKPIKVGLVQINNGFANSWYFPYSVGLLQAYVQKHAKDPEEFEFLEPIFRRVPVVEACAHLAQADVVAFSVYIWNYQLSLAIAERLKQNKPEALIVFGGPHVPDRSKQFLREHLVVDLACHGEGERTLIKILEAYHSRNWEQIPSVSYMSNGDFVQHPKAERVRDLAELPSPYLAGMFDGLVQKYSDFDWLGLWETNRGCPFSCAFCDWGSGTKSKVIGFDMERLEQEIEWFAKNRIEFIFCCDANFGILRRDVDIIRCVAETKRRLGYPKALSVQNTKNATERSYLVQKLLSEAGLNKGVTLSIQTVDPTAAKNIGRQNISLESYKELQRRFNRDGVATYTDLILALPGETYESFTKGVSDIIENGQHSRIQFINLAILPNAEMGDPEYQKRHGFVMVESKIINIHGSLVGAEDGVGESQILVVGTNTMPKEDWVRARAFSWMMALLHFDKVMQIPLIVLHELCGLSYTDMAESFLAAPADTCPIVSSIRDLFFDEARNIQRGGTEYYHAPDWLNIYWPHDEYVFIRLVSEGQLAAFYQEVKHILSGLLRQRNRGVLPVLDDAMDLNRRAIAKPFQGEDVIVEYEYDILALYRSVLAGQQGELLEQRATYRIDRSSNVWHSWDEWAREVVWYGNKKGAYLYNIERIETKEKENVESGARQRA